MADDARRQRILLLVLFAVLAVVLLRQSGGFFGFGGGPQGFGGRGQVADFSSALDTEIEDLELARMEPTSKTLEIGRNPWRYGAAPRPEPPPVQPQPERRPPPVVREPPPQQDTGPREPAKPQPPPIDVTFLGSFGPENRRIAVFEGGDNVVINALVGDLVNDKFRVVSIGLESVDLSFEGFPDTPPERLGIDSR